MIRIAALSAAVTAAVVFAVIYLRFSGEPDGVPVVVAERNIAAGTRISDEMVEVTHVPNEHVVEGAYKDPALVVGQVTKVAFARGEQVASSKVLDSTEIAKFGEVGGFSRSVRLNLEPVTTEGEPVSVGDRVDIRIEHGRGGFADTVVENVEVNSVSFETMVVTVSEFEQLQFLANALSNGSTIKLRRAS